MDYDDIWRIGLLLIGYVIYSAVIKPNIKKIADEPSRQGDDASLGEAFPSIECDECDNGSEGAVCDARQMPGGVSLANVIKGIKSHSKSVSNVKTSDATKQAKPSDDVRHTSPYALTKKADAKRAFIYSEIFNRKY